MGGEQRARPAQEREQDRRGKAERDGEGKEARPLIPLDPVA